jgi:hypothetical protein
MDASLSAARGLRLLLFCAVFLHAAASASAEPVAPSLDASALVRTLAGDGIAGNRDGKGAQAEFMFPAALAYDRRSSALYIADEAAQRIRRLDRDGMVTTVAGGGPLLPSGLGSAGGYKDGPPDEARFDHPSGLAVSADGSLYVADAFNHCVRRVSGAQVSTFVGKPGSLGHQDGPLSAATFTEPRSIALAADGTMYVLDFGVGLRVVRASGVTTLQALGDAARRSREIALWEGADGPVLFLVGENDIFRYDLAKNVMLPEFGPSPQHFKGVRPNGIIPLDRDHVIVSSSALDGLYFVRFGASDGIEATFSRRIAGEDWTEAVQAGGFRDGSPVASAFFAPMDLALDDRGNILVADGGNRRIRLVPAVDTHGFLGHGAASLGEAAHVLIVGDQYVFSNVMWDDSMGALLQARLNTARARLGMGKPVSVETAALTDVALDGQAAYIRDRLRHEGAGLTIVWVLNTRALPPSRIAKEPARLKGLFAQVSSEARVARVNVLLTDHPLGGQLSENDAASLSAYQLSPESTGYNENLDLEHFLSGLGIRYVPALEHFLSVERTAHSPLFASNNLGFSSTGITFYAGLLLDSLEAVFGKS